MLFENNKKHKICLNFNVLILLTARVWLYNFIARAMLANYEPFYKPSMQNN